MMETASTRTARVIVYIDGFNLYHRMKQAYGRRYLWLDLEHLARSLLQPGQQLMVVRYFTALVRNDPAAGSRQADYLEALTSRSLLEVNHGRFQEKNMRCRQCGNRWRTYEEKETDVAIAAALVRDAARGSMDTALIVSADGDLLPAIRAATDMQPQMAIVLGFPPRRVSVELKQHATASFTIAKRKLKAAQLPARVQGRNRDVMRPGYWS